MACENSQTKDPLCVPQTTTFEKHLVWIHRNAPPVFKHKVTIEFVEELVGVLTLN